MRRAAIAILVLLAPPAFAEEARPLLLGVKAGGAFPQPFSPLDATFVVGVEAGWVPSAWRERIAFTASLDFAQPGASGEGTDPRLAEGDWQWTLSQREWIVGVNAMVRPTAGRVTPYGGLGPRLFILETRASGASAGAPFGSYSEISTEIGAALFGGCDVALGPGALVGELELSVADLDHATTGDSNAGSLIVRVGYRLKL